MLAQVVGLFRPIVRQVSEGDVRVVVNKSCALAVQTFMLAMSEAGYDTCPLEGFDSVLVKRALGLPYDCEINMLITWHPPSRRCVGRPLPHTFLRNLSPPLMARLLRDLSQRQSPSALV